MLYGSSTGMGGPGSHVVPAYDLRTRYVTNDLGNSLTPIDPNSGKPGTPIPVDRREAVTKIVRDIQSSQVVGRHDVLRQRPDAEVRDDLERALIDHIHRSAPAVRHVDVRLCATHDRAQVAGVGRLVDVLTIDERRHAGG